MEKEGAKNLYTSTTTTTSRERNHHHNHIGGASGGGAAAAGDTNLISRSQSDTLRSSQSSDLFLQWGNRKRLRCMKFQQAKDDPFSKTTGRVERRVVRGGGGGEGSNNNNNNSINMNQGTHQVSGHFNLRQRSASPAHPSAPITHRVLRNSDSAMKGHSNGGVKRVTSPDRAQDNHHNNKRGGGININHHQENNGNTRNGYVEPGQDNNKKGGSSSGSDGMPAVWPPKFVIALTNKEKEEDFMAIKGSKLPQRPKKRAKYIQRYLNSVSPGGWLCDLTLDRYEVREKKVTKKRPRGLKSMGNMVDSDSD